MTSPVGPSSYGPLDRALGGINSLQLQLSALQDQTTTGRIAQSYAGLGSASARALDLTAAKSRASAYDQVISMAQGKAAEMQAALTRIGAIVGEVSTAALGVMGTPSSDAVAGLAERAKQALIDVTGLLNTQHAGEYVFGGADTANPPVPSPANVTSSGLYTQIGAAVGALATVPTSPALASVIATTVATASSTDPAISLFSPYLLGVGGNAPAATLQVSDTQTVSLSWAANANLPGIASDPGISGTGSAVCDVLRGLAVIANATPALATNPDFPALIQDASKTLASANQTLTVQRGVLGGEQASLAAAADANSAFQIALSRQSSEAMDVDLAETISKLQQVNTQLEASYKLVSLSSGLSLAHYL